MNKFYATALFLSEIRRKKTTGKSSWPGPLDQVVGGRGQAELTEREGRREEADPDARPGAAV